VATILHESDCDLSLLAGRTIAIIGYGAQGHAHALNLHDSGANVLVGLRPNSPNADRASAAGLTVTSIPEAAARAEWVMLTLPDEHIAAVYTADIAPNIQPGSTLFLAHGLAVHYRAITPDPQLNVALVSPKGAGHWVRAEFLAGRGLPAMIAVHQDPSGKTLQYAAAYAAGLGCARTGLLVTSFREETECDLFGEQAILCGGLPALILAGFETLVAAGYQPEAAYFECVYEAKLIVDLLLAKGLHGMRESISNTAEFGGQLAASTLVTPETRVEMSRILARIQSGAFAHQWLTEAAAGAPNLLAGRTAQSKHPSDAARTALLEAMPPLKARLGATKSPE